jgi:hypothetical protein
LAAYPAGGEKLGEIDTYLADILAARGDNDAARSMRTEALIIFRTVYGEVHPLTRALAAQLGTS